MKDSLPLGILFMLIAEIAYTAMWVMVKVGGQNIPVMEIVFFRSAITTVVIFFMALATRTSLRVNNKLGMFGRSLLGCLGIIFSFYALTKISIGDTIVLLNTSPLFVFLLSPLLLKEKFHKSLLFWIIFAFVGVAFVVKPGHGVFEFASIIALLSGITSALALMTVRHLGSTEKTLTIPFYFLLFTALVSAPLMIGDFVMPTSAQWLILLGCGIFGTIAQVVMTYAFMYAPANIITPIGYSGVLFSFIVGWILFGEKPDLYSGVGAFIIVLSILVISLVANKKMNSEKLMVVEN